MPEDKASDKRRKMSLSEQLTYSTVQIRRFNADKFTGSGTGFIINLRENKEKKSGEPFLVTNKHVVADTTHVSFELCRADENRNPIDTDAIPFSITRNQWIDHPDPNVDLCCTPLGALLNIAALQGVAPFWVSLTQNLIPSAETIETIMALEEVVMVGYPKGLEDFHNHKPIMRRGVTATHPKNDYQGKKEILLDIAAFPGSSGSPVFILNQGTYSTPNGFTMSLPPRIFLLGILYGGPEFEVNGTLKFTELPNIPTPVIKLPINLGIIIKAERIRDFETLFPPHTEEN